jgi:hypothetical protein
VATALGSVEVAAGHDREISRGERASHRPVASGGLARELDVIANNMANVGTNGFKARSARFNEFLMPVAKADAFKPADRPLSYVIDKARRSICRRARSR